jgi:glycosyltransferase involved in cell wall biosynthesis
MDTPLVTVIITSYNQEAFIGPALESVVSQDYENLEILACDDASTDGTLSVLHEWARRDARVRVVSADRNTGLSENRNRGLRIHRGEFIALLDGDDLMRPGKIAAQVNLLELEPTAAGCVHDAEIFQSEDGKKLGFMSQHTGARGLRAGTVELWLNPTYVVLPSTMMFRSRFVPEHLLDTRLPFTADWLFSIELYRQGKCVVLDGVYVDYRRHAAQMTTDSAAKGFEEGMMIMGIVDARYPELARLTASMRAALLYGEARRRFRAGERLSALGYARSAARSGGITGHLKLLENMIDARWRGSPLPHKSVLSIDDSLGRELDARPDQVKEFEERMMVTGMLDSKYPDVARRTSAMRAHLLRKEARRRAQSGDRSVAIRYARSAARGRGLLGQAALLQQRIAYRAGA